MYENLQDFVKALAAFPPSGFAPTQSKIPGIQVFGPVDENAARPELVDFKCPRCGATTAFDANSGNLSCAYCGYSETVEATRLGRSAETFEFRVDVIKRSEQGWGEARKELDCQSCGGVVSVPPDVLSYSCPFCGSNEVLYREPLENVLRPRYLIPFQVESQTCREITRKWLGSSWMTPGALRKSMIDKFSPLYIPYWTFSANCKAAWKADVAHEKTVVYFENGERKERHTIEWRKESGKVQKEFQNLLVPGTTRLNMTALGRIDQFNVGDLVLYEPRYLAGMQAQAYDFPLEKAWDAGRQLMRERVRQACIDRASSSQVRNLMVSLDFEDESWRYILTPVYTSIYRYRNDAYQILINGQNGQIAGPRPVDWQKVWLVIAALLAPGLLATLYGLLASTGQAIGAGLFLLVVGLVISFFIVHQAQEMEDV